MPATVPFVGPKKRNDLSPRGKEDDNPDAGGAGWSVTGRSQWLERPETGAQDVVMAHEDQQTARSPTVMRRSLVMLEISRNLLVTTS